MIAATTIMFILAVPVGEAVFHPLEDLDPRLSDGALEIVASKLSSTGSLWRWSAAKGDTLRLKLRTTDPGMYQISLRVVLGDASLSVRAWETSLTRDDEVTLTDGMRLVRFDPIAMGPGYHLLELECLSDADILLEDVGLQLIGDYPKIGGAGPNTSERAFLGIEMGRAQQGGVTINRTIPETAADKAGLLAGDVIVTIQGVRTTTPEAAQDAIASHRPGNVVEVELIRDGRPMTTAVELGRRSDTREQRAEAKQVLDVLQVRPGQVIADIGCGSGWLSEAIAHRLDGEGTVYAVEIQERLVRRLHGRRIANLVPVLSVSDDVSLPEASLDTAMIHDVASHIDRSARPSFYKSVARALKGDGRLVIFGPHGKAASMLGELRGYGYIAVDDDVLVTLSGEELDDRLREGIVFRYHG